MSSLSDDLLDRFRVSRPQIKPKSIFLSTPPQPIKFNDGSSFLAVVSNPIDQGVVRTPIQRVRDVLLFNDNYRKKVKKFGDDFHKEQTNTDPSHLDPIMPVRGMPTPIPGPGQTRPEDDEDEEKEMEGGPDVHIPDPVSPQTSAEHEAVAATILARHPDGSALLGPFRDDFNNFMGLDIPSSLGVPNTADIVDTIRAFVTLDPSFDFESPTDPRMIGLMQMGDALLTSLRTIGMVDGMKRTAWRMSYLVSLRGRQLFEEFYPGWTWIGVSGLQPGIIPSDATKDATSWTVKVLTGDLPFPTETVSGIDTIDELAHLTNPRMSELLTTINHLIDDVVPSWSGTFDRFIRHTTHQWLLHKLDLVVSNPAVGSVQRQRGLSLNTSLISQTSSVSPNHQRLRAFIFVDIMVNAINLALDPSNAAPDPLPHRFGMSYGMNPMLPDEIRIYNSIIADAPPDISSMVTWWLNDPMSVMSRVARTAGLWSILGKPIENPSDDYKILARHVSRSCIQMTGVRLFDSDGELSSDVWIIDKYKMVGSVRSVWNVGHITVLNSLSEDQTNPERSLWSDIGRAVLLVGEVASALAYMAGGDQGEDGDGDGGDGHDDDDGNDDDDDDGNDDDGGGDDPLLDDGRGQLPWEEEDIDEDMDITIDTPEDVSVDGDARPIVPPVVVRTRAGFTGIPSERQGSRSSVQPLGVGSLASSVNTGFVPHPQRSVEKSIVSFSSVLDSGHPAFRHDRPTLSSFGTVAGTVLEDMDNISGGQQMDVDEFHPEVQIAGIARPSPGAHSRARRQRKTSVRRARRELQTRRSPVVTRSVTSNARNKQKADDSLRSEENSSRYARRVRGILTVLTTTKDDAWWKSQFKFRTWRKFINAVRSTLDPDNPDIHQDYEKGLTKIRKKSELDDILTSIADSVPEESASSDDLEESMSHPDKDEL